MNERIQALANEATCFKEGLTEGLYDIEIFDKEKFAELIVRECAELSADNPGYNGLNIFDKILKHFGVKE
jgi:hypothetical protein